MFGAWVECRELAGKKLFQGEGMVVDYMEGRYKVAVVVAPGKVEYFYLEGRDLVKC